MVMMCRRSAQNSQRRTTGQSIDGRLMVADELATSDDDLTNAIKLSSQYLAGESEERLLSFPSLSSVSC
jgi:hypothetical protein